MEFLYPTVLWIMLLPVLLLVFLISTNKNNMELIFKKETLDKLISAKSGLSLNTRNTLIFISLILMVLSLSRPVILQKEKELKQNLIPVIIALDVSKSMLSNDIYPNRLELSKKKIKEFLKVSKNSAVGIVLFANSSFILSPITQDFPTLLYMIENMGKNLNFDNGSNILGMLESANQLLETYDNKNIIILSDGGNKNSYKKEIEYAKQNNIKIYTIATASKNGAPIPTKDGYLTDTNGNIVTVKLNESIKELAINSGGGYIDYTIDNKDIEAIIYELLSRSKKEQMDTKKIKVYTELFYYPLALALLFLFISISSLPKLKQKNLIVLFLLCFIDKGYSGLLDFQTLSEAKKAYEEKNYQYSTNQYKKVVHNNEGYYNLGNSLYKEGKYEEAIKNYEEVVTSDSEFEAKKLHNMGNAYVKLNNLQKAKEMYENALKKHFDKETKENLDKITEAANQNKQNKQKKEDKNNKNNQKNTNENKDNKSNNKQKEEDKDSKQNQKDDINKDNKKEDKKNSKKQEQKNSSKQNSQKEFKVQEISDLEEKKWMEKLKNTKTPIMLHKMDTKSRGEESSTPW